MSDINIVSGKGRNKEADHITAYLNYIRNNNRAYFTFKDFSQIQTVGDNLMSKKDGYVRVIFENVNGLPVGYLEEKYNYKHLNQKLTLPLLAAQSRAPHQNWRRTTCGEHYG